MKGVSLALETIIVLILAVSVLSVSMWFLYSNVGPGQARSDLEREKALYCGSYSNTDPKCEGDISGSNRVPKHSGALKNIRDTCSKLHDKNWGFYPACEKGLETNDPKMLTCIRQCCNMYCP